MKDKSNIKNFLIKLAAITFAIIVVINVSYNLILADKFEAINKIMNISEKENIESIKDKIRSEIRSGLEKEKVLKEEDAKLLNKFYKKLKNEISQAEGK
tara:strand:- start:158 stop:454 length:297 start_codon:yes stop_codon:yes gene_type:complete